MTRNHFAKRRLHHSKLDKRVLLRPQGSKVPADGSADRPCSHVPFFPCQENINITHTHTHTKKNKKNGEQTTNCWCRVETLKKHKILCDTKQCKMCAFIRLAPSLSFPNGCGRASVSWEKVLQNRCYISQLI